MVGVQGRQTCSDRTGSLQDAGGFSIISSRGEKGEWSRKHGGSQFLLHYAYQTSWLRMEVLRPAEVTAKLDRLKHTRQLKSIKRAPDVVVEDGCVAAGGGQRGLVPGERRDARTVTPQLPHLLHPVCVPDLHLQGRSIPATWGALCCYNGQRARLAWMHTWAL